MSHQIATAFQESLKSFQEVLQNKIDAISNIAEEIPAIVFVNNIKTLSVEYISKRGLDYHGITFEDIRELGDLYFDRYLNQEDFKDYAGKLQRLIEENNNDEVVSFFQQVKGKTDSDWNWFFTTSKVFMRDGEGLPTHIVSVSCPVDPQHHITAKVNRLLNENMFLRKNGALFASLTKREKEVLKLMVCGDSAMEIAQKLFISEKTASTHRRNIRTKLKATTNYDLTLFAQAFDLI